MSFTRWGAPSRSHTLRERTKAMRERARVLEARRQALEAALGRSVELPGLSAGFGYAGSRLEGPHGHHEAPEQPVDEFFREHCRVGECDDD